MLVCFGAAWPASIWKSWRSRTAKGKSLFFMLIVFVGYTAGIAKTILTEGVTGFMMIPYLINAALVTTDILLYFRNAALDRRSAAQGCAP